jgi:hypothetical protein
VKADAWKITPGIGGFDYSLVPVGMESSWGIGDCVQEVLDSILDEGHGALAVEKVEVELAVLLDLDCGDGYAIDMHESDFLGWYEEADLREADARRPSGERHWPEEARL